MFTFPSVLMYVAIFVAKLIEVTIATMRNVLINRGQKKLGAFLAFFETVIWLYIVSAVLSDIQSDLMKVFCYCLAFACGNYVGATLEERIAIGMSAMEIYVIKEISGELVDALRQAGFGVTTIDSYGKEHNMIFLKVYLKRKQTAEATDLVRKIAPSAFLTVSDIKRVSGGYIKK